jgi:Protein of unknown function (DUF732)
MTDDDEAAEPTSVGAGDDATTVVPPPTEAAPTLAYSDEPEREEPGSWRDSFIAAALPLFIAAAVLLVSLVGFWLWMEWPQQERVIVERTQMTVTTAPPPWTPPIVVTSTVPPVTSTVTVKAAPPGWTPRTSDPEVVTPTADELFLQRLTAAGFTITDPSVAVSSARGMCADFDHRETYGQAFAAIRRNNASIQPRDVPTYIAAVVQSFCPRYTNMLRENEVNQ